MKNGPDRLFDMHISAEGKKNTGGNVKLSYDAVLPRAD